MTVKTHTSPRTNRFLAALLAFFMLVSVCSIGAYADADDDAYALMQQIQSDLDAIQDADWDTWEAMDAAYQAFYQKYPDRPDVALVYSDATSFDTAEEDLSFLDHVIELAQNYSGPAYFIDNLDSAADIIASAYDDKADIYFRLLHQQDDYISAMRSALDAREQSARQRFADGTGWGWTSAVSDLQYVQANRAELDAIEQWYRAGSPINFTAWNGRVQVTASADNRSIQVQMQTPGSEHTEWEEDEEGYYIEAGTTPYSSVTEEIVYSAAYCSPVSTVLRAVDQVRFYGDTDWDKFNQATSSMSSEEWEVESDSILQEQTIFHTDDGTPLTSEYLEEVHLGSVSDFCNVQTLSLPDNVKSYLRRNERELWDAGGESWDTISYDVYASY